MKVSYSWEAGSYVAAQELPTNVRKPKVHYYPVLSSLGLKLDSICLGC
jgi:hypothetical protein